MADFCKTCSIAMFGQDFGDLAKLLDEKDYSDTHGALALCECCGPVVVDYEGQRVSKEHYPSCICAQMTVGRKVE